MKRAASILVVVGLLVPAAMAQPAEQPVVRPKRIVAPGAVQPAGQPVAKTPAKAEAIYDETADAKGQIAAAVAKAKKENQRVLVQWGGNWCGWCKALHKTMATDQGLRKELMYEYVVVPVDIGHFDKNMDVAMGYGADLKKHGVPYLTVLDADGKAVANQETDPLEVKGEDGKSVGVEAGHDPKKVMAFLTEHQSAHQQADVVLKDAMDRAKESGRVVFVHVGAPWCGWCHRMEDWMARKDIEPLIAKDFVDVKIDQDRMTGADGVKERLGMPKDSGIPWFAFLDASSGKVLVDSVMETKAGRQTIGFPSEDEEIQHFMTMLEKVHKNLTASDLTKIRESLVAEHAKLKAH